jgi:SAM-dependent methyltransferase
VEDMGVTAEHARRAVEANPSWYHTIDLGGGVATPGYVDWRRDAARVLPNELSGRRVLDIGTFDGFWAFELEKRGADVVAMDLAKVDDADWPPIHRERLVREQREFGVELGRGFRLAHECLGSSVERVECDVRELTAEAIGGQVDLAFIGAMLLHLRDPVRALENVREVLVPGGALILLESISLRETLVHPRSAVARFQAATHVFNWWVPNLRALRDYLWCAGFERISRVGGFLHPPSKPEMSGWYAAYRAHSPR